MSADALKDLQAHKDTLDNLSIWIPALISLFVLVISVIWALYYRHIENQIDVAKASLESTRATEINTGINAAAQRRFNLNMIQPGYGLVKISLVCNYEDEAINTTSQLARDLPNSERLITNEVLEPGITIEMLDAPVRKDEYQRFICDRLISELGKRQVFAKMRFADLPKNTLLVFVGSNEKAPFKPAIQAVSPDQVPNGFAKTLWKRNPSVNPKPLPADEAPNLTCDLPTMGPLDSRDGIPISVLLHNIGKSTATIDYAGVQLLRPHGTPSNRNFEDAIDQVVRGIEATVEQNSELLIERATPEGIGSKQEIDDIRTGTSGLYAVARIEYRDKNMNRWEARFCWVYDAKKQTFVAKKDVTHVVSRNFVPH